LLVVLSVVHNLTPIGLVRLSGGSARVMLLPFLLPLALLALPALSYWGPEQWAPMEVDWLGRHLPLALPGLLSALVLAQCLHYLAVLRILPDGPCLCPTGIVGGQIKNIFSGKTALAPASPSSLTVSAPE